MLHTTRNQGRGMKKARLDLSGEGKGEDTNGGEDLDMGSSIPVVSADPGELSSKDGGTLSREDKIAFFESLDQSQQRVLIGDKGDVASGTIIGRRLEACATNDDQGMVKRIVEAGSKKTAGFRLRPTSLRALTLLPVTAVWVFLVAAASSVALASSLPCSPDLRVSWVVNNSATASELARASNCSGGVFDVEWIGHVEIPETIYIVDDTVMNITGAGAGAVADGANRTQFLNVVNAAMYVSGLRIQNCTSELGGAIYADTSTMSFINTTWSDNTAAVDGGAVYVYNSSHVSWSGETTWSHNTAASDDGGAVFVNRSSDVSWSGSSMWFDNSAGDHGGAVYVHESSHVSWSGETTWSHNTASGDGGALWVWDSSDVSWSGETTWSDNSAGDDGGAVYMGDSANVSWSGETTWSHNNADDEGGAVYVYDSDSVSWSGEMTFLNNIASVYGGAVVVTSSSNVSWNGETTWSNNTAGEGGAVNVYLGSDVSWSGNTTFLNNTAGVGGAVDVYGSSVSWSGETTYLYNIASVNGGAVVVTGSSDVSWSGETTFSNNAAGITAGAVAVFDSSGVSWSGETTFSNNTAGVTAGAVAVFDSSGVSWSGNTTWSSNIGNQTGAVHIFDSWGVSWSGETTFLNNTAGEYGADYTADSDGGAVYVYLGSDVSWSGETTFSDNTAGQYGGAVFVLLSSDVSWRGGTTFSNNTAGTYGGAVYLVDSSGVYWSGETTWSHNSARFGAGAVNIGGSSGVSWSGHTVWSLNSADFFDGGAVRIATSSNVSWIGETVWSHNAAVENGGAVSMVLCSNVSWIGETVWSSNIAGNDGGAVFVTNSVVSWSGETTWANNTAGVDGGAVAVQDSDASLSGETKWSHNTAGKNGGALYVTRLHSESIVFMSSSSVFECNTAGAGGAVMLSGVIVGPEFIETNFTANRASTGGAVYSISSGGDDSVVYEDCLFRDNQARVTGGAIESAAGTDMAVNSVFEGNTAGVGGALRLGGYAILTNCTFVDNTAADEGPAISNLGLLVIEGNSSRFSGNVFSCERGMYLDSVDGHRYQTVCDGCPVNNSDWIVSVENEDRVPICMVQLEHTRSEGGDTTIETLDLNAGYWRATNNSDNVLACYNEDACAGGITDDPDFCRLAYEGPYCSVCTEGFSKSLAFTCTECVDDHGGIAIMVVVGVFVLGAAIALCMHLVSGEMEGARRGVVDRVIKRLPLQSIKIVVVVWQILTQFSSVANVTYPDVYQRFLDGVNVLNFDVLWIPSAGCLVEVDFHGRLLVATIGPLVALALLAITYTVAKRRSSGSEAVLQKIRHKHMSMVLLITFLVYSSVSATVFQTFACEDLDDRKKYLRADYRIECDSSEHQAFQVFAGIMILVYPVGIPLFYGYLLYKHRRVLKSEDAGKRETSPQVQPISDLWFPYKPGRFYYEVIECVRRMSLTGVVVFIYPNTAAQVAVTLMIAFSFVVTSVVLAPYVSKWDASISLAGHVIVFTSMYTALLSKVDVSDERADSQEVFAGILVAAHACMVVAVVVETVVIFWSMRRNKGPVCRNGPHPRVYGKGSVPPLQEDPVLS